ncbi:MAG: hypothetical protein ABUT20_39530 [Bacteroidota bacterium]
MKKLFPFLLILAFISVLGSSGCYYDVEDRLYPKTSCDTTNITYSTTIVSILQNNGCLTCHGGTATAGGNIVLDTYAGVKPYAQNGHLMGSVNQETGYSAMPLGGSKLSSCDIQKINTWINSGIPQN